MPEAEPRLTIGQGEGNEEDRLSLLRQHQRRVTAQIAELTECLDLITFKIQLYEACRAEGLLDPLLTPEDGPGAH